ncbi:MAG: hypothetical protein QXQ64_08475 [Candidatus Bathyarchaeia archaeon]
MGKCPFCGSLIVELEYSATEFVRGGFTVRDGVGEYYGIESVDVDDQEYRCPVCGKVVACCEEEAGRILSSDGR